MLKRLLVLLMLLILRSASAQSQNKTIIAGKFVDSVSNGFKGNLKFGIDVDGYKTDIKPTASGDFTIEVPLADAQEISISNDSFMIKRFKINNSINGVVHLGNIVISSNPIVLKEVVIKSKRRYRDTAWIDLSNENFQRSVMVDDIFFNQWVFQRC